MSLCVTTVVDKNYMAYVPLFVYCMNRSYPEYKVKLFLRDPCPYNLDRWRLKCEVVPMFECFPQYQYLSIALRFAIPKGQFKDFDYVYTTDIDMMIMRESKDIEYFHAIEMNDTKLCYSNSLRNALHYAGSDSLSGLHFASRQWYEKTDDLVTEYRRNMELGLLGTYREYDGVMLYRIADRCGLGLPGKYKLAKRHHGIHLGNFRKDLFFDDKLKLDVRITNEYRSQWMQYLSHQTFREIIETCRHSNDTLNMQVEMLERLCLGRL